MSEWDQPTFKTPKGIAPFKGCAEEVEWNFQEHFIALNSVLGKYTLMKGINM
jgi:hypothetical protein